MGAVGDFASFGEAEACGAFGGNVSSPAPRSEVRGQGLHCASQFDSGSATYEDQRMDYVTSEPAIDYTASSMLLMAALEGRC